MAAVLFRTGLWRSESPVKSDKVSYLDLNCLHRVSRVDVVIDTRRQEVGLLVT